jgi:hypothetical protein
MVLWVWTEMWGNLGVFYREFWVCSSLTCYWRERAIWLLVNAYLGEMRSSLSPERHIGRDGDGECSRPLRTDRQLTLLQWTFTVQTARLVLGGGAG